MTIGLGLGLGHENARTIAAAGLLSNAAGDWSSWDGANDGAVKQYVTAGGMGASASVGVSATRAMIMTSDTDGTAFPFVFFVDRDGDTLEDAGASVNLSVSGELQWPNIVRLSAARSVVFGYSTGSSAIEVFLIDTSGSAPVELDQHTVTGLIQTNWFHDTTALSTTKALGIFREMDGTDKPMIGVFDFTGDIITQGTLVNGTISGSLTNSVAVIALTDSTAVYSYRSNIGYITISGIVPSVAATGSLSYIGSGNQDKSLQRIDDTHALIFAEDVAGDNKIYASVLSWNGSAISSGAEIEVYTDNNSFTGAPSGWTTNVENNHFLAITRDDDASPTNASGVAVTVDPDDSYSLSVTSEIDVSGAIQADHNYTCVFPDTNGKYALWVCQDETTTPIRQITARVLVAPDAD